MPALRAMRALCPLGAAVLAALALAAATPGGARSLLRPALLPPPAGLQAGDWVFRGGLAADSRWIRALSHSRYSHVGMVVQTAPQVLIAHATTDDDPQRPGQIILSPWQAFASASMADTLAVARPRFLSASQRAASARHLAARIGQPFALRARSHQPRYCTTVLLDAVRTQAPGFNPAWQWLDLPALRGQYLFPQALAHSNLQWLAATPAAEAEASKNIANPE